MTVAFAGLTAIDLVATPHTIVPILGLIVLWGVSAWSFFPAQQNRLIGIGGPPNTPVVLSLNASFMYLGFAGGAALGSLVIAHLSVAWIGTAGAITLIAAMAMSRFAWARV